MHIVNSGSCETEFQLIFSYLSDMLPQTISRIPRFICQTDLGITVLGYSYSAIEFQKAVINTKINLACLGTEQNTKSASFEIYLLLILTMQ